MNMSEALAAIQAHFCPLSAESSQALAAQLSPHAYPKDTLLVQAGQYADQLFFIYKGVLRAFYLKDGKDITDWFAFDGHFICAINSFFMEIPSPHSIEILEASEIYAIPRPAIEALCQRYHDIERLARLSVTQTMLQLQQRVVSLQFETAQSRYQSLLQTFPDIEQRVALRHIASFLGITQETLSRIRKAETRI